MRILHDFLANAGILLLCELLHTKTHSMAMKKVANRRIPLYIAYTNRPTVLNISYTKCKLTDAMTSSKLLIDLRISLSLMTSAMRPGYPA